MAKCRKLKTPVRTKSGRMRRCKIKSSKRKSKSSKRKSKSSKRKSKSSKRKSSKRKSSKRKSSKRKSTKRKPRLSKAAKALQRRCNSRANYDCYSDPNCRLKVLKGKRSRKRVKCVPRSKAKKNPPTYYGPINMSMDKRIERN